MQRTTQQIRFGLRLLAAVAAMLVAAVPAHFGRAADESDGFRLAAFEADVTIPLGHPIIAGGRMPAQEIVDPLSARGFVLLGADKPLVVASVEWCEIRNDAYDRWRDMLAEAAGTDRQHVLVTATHVHDAPVVDLAAQKLLEEHKAQGKVCDLAFHEQAVQRTAAALRESLKHPRRITHLGVGQAKVDKVASNRRYELPDGKVSYHRSSAAKDPHAKAASEGTTDPMLKTLSFWDGDSPVLALHAYAVHPMSYYGKGGVSDDFVGQARRRRQADQPDVFQIYVSGCSGNLTAGKYNDGAPENRPVLAGRIHDAMVGAWNDTKRFPLENVDFRCAELRLTPRRDPEFSKKSLLSVITDGNKLFPSVSDVGFAQGLAAMGLSWIERVESGQPIDVPAVDFGPAKLLLLPAESYVEYQLFAQRLCPEDFVMVMGYGESAPGYIPTEKAVAERDPNLDLWRWIEPPCERAMHEAILKVICPGTIDADGGHEVNPKNRTQR